MLEQNQISKKATGHFMTCLYLVAAVYLLVLVLGYTLFGEYQNVVIAATSVAAVITLLESYVVSKLWGWVARKHQDSLPTFYTACSGFRILYVLVVLTVIYLIVGGEKIVPFVAVFMVFYFIMLVAHSFFFSRMTKKLFDDNTNKE